ncbi:MAG: hypothetical protein Q4F97_09455 [Bacteroidales bacterium]|nr:hypothetical protein [Bacteroidales bacterium]
MAIGNGFVTCYFLHLASNRSGMISYGKGIKKSINNIQICRLNLLFENNNFQQVLEKAFCLIFQDILFRLINFIFISSDVFPDFFT